MSALQVMLLATLCHKPLIVSLTLGANFENNIAKLQLGSPHDDEIYALGSLYLKQPVSRAEDCMGMLDVDIRDNQSSTLRGLLQAIQDWRHALQNRGIYALVGYIYFAIECQTK